MEAMIDVLIYIVLIGGAAVIGGMLLLGIYHFIKKIRNLNRVEDWATQRISEGRQYIRENLGHLGNAA
jgi:hypothetical protein